jgi:hypothetical protein
MTGWQMIVGGFQNSTTQCYGTDGGINIALFGTSKIWYGPGEEQYVDVPTRPGNSNYVSLTLRGASCDGSTGYSLVYTQVTGTANDTLEIINAANSAVLGTYTFSGGDPADGFSFGGSAIGSAIKVYYKPSGGSYSEVISITDSTFTDMGCAGLVVTGTTARLDNYGGGFVGTCSTSTDGPLFDFTGTTPITDKFIYENYFQATQFTATGTDVTEYEINIVTVTVAGNLTMQLYTDSSNSIGSAITGTDVTLSVSTTGIKTFTLSSMYSSLVPGTKYWMKASVVGSPSFRANSVSNLGGRYWNGEGYYDDLAHQMAVLGCAR